MCKLKTVTEIRQSTEYVMNTLYEDITVSYNSMKCKYLITDPTDLVVFAVDCVIARTESQHFTCDLVTHVCKF